MFYAFKNVFRRPLREEGRPSERCLKNGRIIRCFCVSVNFVSGLRFVFYTENVLSENNQWQTVKDVSIKAKKLNAYNLTVENDHIYFIKGANSDSDGVWVHNDCWHALPDGAQRIGEIEGYHAYKFKN